MDKKEASKIAIRYITFIKKQEPSLKKAYLFGSYARGTDRKDSDIDLAVIFSDLKDTFDMQVKLMKLRRNFDTRIEPHTFRESDFILSNPLANEILRTGLEIM